VFVHGKYAGHVSRQDPLYGLLCWILRDRLGVAQPHPTFRAFPQRGSNEVYAYEEKFTGTKIVCKFFGKRFGWDRDKALSAAQREYDNLKTLRAYGLVGAPHHVIRPLALNRDINCVLALEYFPGESLSDAITRSIDHRDDAHLYWRLKALAYYLATQHNRTANGSGVDFNADCRYLDQVVGRLRTDRGLGQWDSDEFYWLRDLWRERSRMWQDQQVWLHGDATPANFLFGHGMNVAAIDLERMKRGDRMFDVGRIAGELQHAFMSATGDRRRAEPFIGHFLWEYSCHFPDRHDAFTSITQRTPFYMALNLLRIARNDYIAPDYRRALVSQSKKLLRAS
jgi:aminoglycoside phosphotransferase (APT) family kinase protein